MPRQFVMTRDGYQLVNEVANEVRKHPGVVARVDERTGDVQAFMAPRPYYEQDPPTGQAVHVRDVRLNEDSGEVEDAPPSIEDVIAQVDAVAARVARLCAKATSRTSQARNGAVKEANWERFRASIEEELAQRARQMGVSVPQAQPMPAAVTHGRVVSVNVRGTCGGR